MTSPLTAATNLFTDDFPGSALRTTLWVPLANGANFKGQTWTFSSPDPYTTTGGGFPTVSNNTARFALQTWDGKSKDHAFLGTEAITIDAWNPTTGGLSFEGKFKFSGDGTGNQAALNQARHDPRVLLIREDSQGTITPRSTSRSSPATSKTPL